MQPKRTPESLVVSREFGRRVKEARKAQGVSSARFQERLAEHGVRWDTSAVARVEAGRREPRLTEVLAVVDILGISLAGFATPKGDSDDYAGDLRRLVENSRKAVLELLRAIDRAPVVLETESAPTQPATGSHDASA
jgi:transcriptional regulator with XRE-family HTH domain